MGLFRELFLRPLWSQKKRLAGVVVALVFMSISEGLFLLMVKGFVTALFQDASRLAIPVAELLPEKALAYLPALQGASVPHAQLALVVPLVILVAGLSNSLADYLYQLNQQALALFLARSYREKLFRAVLALPYVEIRRRQVGQWMSLIMNDVMLLQTRFTDIMTGLIKDTVVIVAAFTVLAVIHWPTALGLLVLAPFIAFGMGRTGKRIARYSEAFQRELGRIAGAVLDLRARFDFIRAQQAEERELSRFAVMNLRYFRMIRRSIMIRSAFAPVLEFTGFLVFAGFVYAIGRGYLGKFTPELMMQLLVALGLLLRPLREMGEQLSRFHETRGTLQNSLDTFKTLAAGAVPAAADLATGPGLAPSAPLSSSADSDQTPAALGFKTALVIRHIQAGMGGEVRFTASDLRLSPGRAVAIIGPSGAGKSTLLKTLAGLVEPHAWDAGVTWREATDLVSMVSQDPFLFDDTIDANLVYGLASDRQPAKDEIRAALATVNIEREVQALPDGLATRLRAIGSNVSGGQLQRLVIARGLLRQKPIWLLDEATSAVDAKSEKDITHRLIDACRSTGHALLAVTHRLTWLGSFDEVWFVENGRLTLAGPHQELLAEPRYRDYCASAGGAHAGE